MAVEEMNAKLPMRDGAGEELEEWVASWTETGTDDFAAVNVGQLKALAQRFYDRLADIGLESNVPWDGVADDFALANIGQVKQVFAIEFFDPLDTDADGLA